MFVVPYDFRDMPPMSMTFIRQRILAYDEGMKTAGKNIDQLSTAEQMKLLRYGIHLRLVFRKLLGNFKFLTFSNFILTDSRPLVPAN